MTSPEDAPQRARVVTVDPETGKVRHRRVVFEGLYDDAHSFVENNYPRPHVEPGNGGMPSPDVVVQTLHDNGKVESTYHYHADHGFRDYVEPGEEPEDDLLDEEDE